MRYELLALIPAILLFLSIVYLAIIFYYVKTLVKPRRRTIEEILDYEVEEKGFQKKWLDIPFEEMHMLSKRGYNLYAKFYKNSKPTNKIMISLHGHGSCSLSQMKYLEMFLGHGFNVFMPDHRYSGHSEGGCITLGVLEHEDVLQWINVLTEQYPDCELHIFGESMGAATATMVTAKYSDIRSLIEYCGFYDLQTMTKQYVKNESIAKIVWPAFRGVCKLVYKFDLAESKAGEAMAKINCPVLLMHSKADKVVSYENALKFKKVRPDIPLVTFEDTVHARSIVMEPDKFKSSICRFFKENGIVD
ncbi:MAG TPA: alpha/beta fold hydrolase [Clostridia bacterium]|jgi:hypothetical protein|nr:alpha/beta fold hydrolase [Clostridia bacterium]